MPAARPDHFRALDLVRGSAALLVVLFHAAPRSTDLPPGWLASAHWIMAHGWFGVHLFFVVSGYCITAAVAREYAQRRSGGAFLVDRARRIFPTYWIAFSFAILLAVAATPFNGAPLVSAADRPGAIPAGAGDFMADALLLLPWLGRSPYLDVSWTLTVELTLYTLSAGALLLASRLRSPRMAVALSVTLGFACLLLQPWVARSPICYWPTFICGVAVWFAANGSARAAWGWRAVIVGLGATGAIATALKDPLPLAALFALLLTALHRFDATLASLPMLGWLRSIGVVSYSLYLFHFPLVTAGGNLIARVWPKESPWFIVLSLALTFGAVVAAMLFYRMVEAPFERHRKSRRQILLVAPSQPNAVQS